MGAAGQKLGKSELAQEMSPSVASGRISWLRNSCVTQMLTLGEARLKGILRLSVTFVTFL